MFVFFFSSRRRHTRYWRDWSSDVCSSDLNLQRRRQTMAALLESTPVECHAIDEEALLAGLRRGDDSAYEQMVRAFGGRMRSGERRVGEEGRSRGAPYH